MSRALGRDESLLVANEPQPERVMVFDQLPDSGFEGVDVRWLAQFKQQLPKMPAKAKLVRSSAEVIELGVDMSGASGWRIGKRSHCAVY